MKNVNLLIYSFMAFFFGLVLVTHADYAKELVYNGHIFGGVVIGLAVVTWIVMLFHNQKANRIAHYMHVAVLGALTVFTLMRYFEGAINVIWVFTLGILSLIIHSIVRGDVIE